MTIATSTPMRLGDLSVGFTHSIAAAMAQHGVAAAPLFERFELDT